MSVTSDEMLRALATEVADGLVRTGQRLVTAESCTGGWIGKICTDLPGSSRWFLGGAIVYANEAKTGLLGVDPALLRRDGAVSEAAVRSMAAGALERLGGERSVAVTGIAGPDGGRPDKPVGTVWFAWGRRDARGVSVVARVEQFEGDRESIRRQAVARALGGLLAP